MKRVRLGDVADVMISGIDKKTKEGEKAVKLCNFVDVYYNWAITKYLYDDLMSASASDSDIETFTLRKGQVAITKDSETRDDIGVAAYIADDFDDVVLGYHCALITPKDDIAEEDRIYGKYLNAILHTKYAQKHFSNNATGSGQRYTLSKETVEDMIVYLPSPKEQERIGNYLSEIDHKIELNNLINEKLEDLAKQIYDYWFVQFDFPNEEGKPYKSSGGKMVWNDIIKRPIPEGWSIKTIGDFAEIKSGYPFKSELMSDYGKYKIVTIRNVQNNYLDIKNLSYTDTLPDNLKEHCKLEIGDMLISLTGNVGRVCTVYINGLLLNQRVGIIKPKIDHKQWLSYIFRDTTVRSRIENWAGGCAQANVSPLDIEKLQIIKPTDDLLSKFEKYTVSNTLSIIKLNESNLLLSQLREFLLPLLMNGQITIKD